MEKSTDTVHTNYVETTCPHCGRRDKYHGIRLDLCNDDVRTCKYKKCEKEFTIGYYRGEDDV